MTSLIYAQTGFHTQESLNKELPGCSAKARGSNFYKAAGYCPIITGQIMGCLYLAAGCNDKLSCLERIYFIVRGILTFIGAGFLFIIPDVIVTLHRHFCKDEPTVENHLNFV